jgi:hypothetical protein
MLKRAGKNRYGQIILSAKQHAEKNIGTDRKGALDSNEKYALDTEDKFPIVARAEDLEAQVPKLSSNSGLSQMIEQRTLENGQLRMELRRQVQRNQASMFVVAQTRRVMEDLQRTLANFQTLCAEVGDDLIGDDYRKSK